MALFRNSVGLTLGTARFFAGGLSHIHDALPINFQPYMTSGTSSSKTEESTKQGPGALQSYVRERSNTRVADNLGLTFACHLAGKKEEKEQQPAQRPLAQALASALRAPASSSLLPGRLAGRGLAGSSLMRASRIQTAAQTRAYNAWSPAQRYFVEGDHVVAAEINRTFQFTGLDGGSFYPYVVFAALATAISTVFMVLPMAIAPSRVDLDKSSAYECGFDAFGEARQTFSVSFYLVSIMYLLFDIEIVYLFPYAMTHASVPMYWTMNLFLALLVAGFAYEWGMGALEWRE